MDEGLGQIGNKSLQILYFGCSYNVGCVLPTPPLDETSYEAGIKVQLHAQSEPPRLRELGFGVALGFQTFVSTQEQRVAYCSLGDAA